MEDFAHEEYLLQELEEGATYRLSQISAPVFGSDGAVALALTVVGLPEKLTGEEIPRFGDALRRRGPTCDRIHPRERADMNPDGAGPPSTSTGRVAVVTGAASGIGRASAVLLGAAGAAVVCADLDGDRRRGHRRAARRGRGHAPWPGGSTSRWPARSTTLVDAAVSELGRLDVMANVAGIIVQAPVVDFDDDAFDRILAVNLHGVFRGCRAAARVMSAQGSGSIVNMASAAIDTPVTGPGRLRHGQGGRGAAHPGARHRDGARTGCGSTPWRRGSWRRP